MYIHMHKHTQPVVRSYDPAFFNTVEGEMCMAGWDFNQGSTIDLVSVANEAINQVTASLRQREGSLGP